MLETSMHVVSLLFFRNQMSDESSSGGEYEESEDEYTEDITEDSDEFTGMA